MSTPLHELEVFHSLAEGSPGPARDWALARLALLGEPIATLPDDPELHDIVIAMNPEGLADLCSMAVKTPGVAIASAVATAGLYGVLPENGEALIGALRGALGNDRSADPWIGLALLRLGALTPTDLPIVARGHTDLPWLLPALVLTVAHQLGEGPATASQLVTQLGETLVREADALYQLLGTLGVPLDLDLHSVSDQTSAANCGAALAGSTRSLSANGKGSRKRRTQRWVQRLLDGVDIPAALFLRALYATPQPSLGLVPVALASWLAHFEASDPLMDVLRRHAGGNVRTLSAARRAITDAEGPNLIDALASGSRHCACLAVPLLRGPHGPALADQLIDAALYNVGMDLQTDMLACIAAAHHPARIPELLADPETRPIGLILAEWVPTMEVLAALLEQPMPATAPGRIQLARSLAAMGDGSVLPMLRELLVDDPDHDWARSLATALLATEI